MTFMVIFIDRFSLRTSHEDDVIYGTWTPHDDQQIQRLCRVRWQLSLISDVMVWRATHVPRDPSRTYTCSCKYIAVIVGLKRRRHEMWLGPTDSWTVGICRDGCATTHGINTVGPRY